MSRDEAEALETFRERYSLPRLAVNVEVEQAVIGGNWGANGYTTMAQADELGGLVGATADRVVLDVGAGRGWPGLYLAATTGCRVILTDLPREGLQTAIRRAAAEGLSSRVDAVVATASRLPLRSATVDAVIATDVLC